LNAFLSLPVRLFLFSFSFFFGGDDRDILKAEINSYLMAQSSQHESKILFSSARLLSMLIIVLRNLAISYIDCQNR
jgi:hypothetical protein